MNEANEQIHRQRIYNTNKVVIDKLDRIIELLEKISTQQKRQESLAANASSTPVDKQLT